MKESYGNLSATRVKSTREALGLNIHAFAEVFGVAVSTVYRWEDRGAVNVDPLQGRLLAATDAWVRANRAQAKAKGAVVLDALVQVGPLAALRTLLGEVVGK